MMFPFDNLEEDFTTDFQSFFIPTFFDQLTAISSMTRGVEMTYVAPDDPDTVLPNEDPAPLGSSLCRVSLQLAVTR